MNPDTASNVNVAIIVKYSLPIEGGVPVNVREAGVNDIQLGRGSPLAIRAVYANYGWFFPLVARILS